MFRFFFFLFLGWSVGSLAQDKDPNLHPCKGKAQFSVDKKGLFSGRELCPSNVVSGVNSDPGVVLKPMDRFSKVRGAFDSLSSSRSRGSGKSSPSESKKTSQ